MPRSSRPVGTRVTSLPPLVALLAVLALLAAACSAQPVSEVGTGPDTAATSATASASPAVGTESAPPSAPPGTASPATPRASSSAGAGTPPDKPTGTTFAILSEQPADGGGVRQTHRITWDAPDGQAASFVVFGVKACLRSSAANNGTPCVIKGMRIPKNALVKLAEAPGTDRSVDVAWVVPKSGKEPYAAVLIRATNPAGDSIFAIVHSEEVCTGC